MRPTDSRYQKLSTEDRGRVSLEPADSTSSTHRTSISKPSRLVYLVLGLVFLVVGLFFSLSLVPASALSGIASLDSKPTLSLTPSANWSKLLQTLENIEEKFNRRLGYPVQLLVNGELPSEGIRSRTEWITGGKAKWSLVTKDQGWGPPSWISSKDVQASVDKIGFSEGYRNMCRFFSMHYWRHPAVKDYEWIWRLDDTSRFHCALMEDPIELMKNSSTTYGYSQIEHESLYVIPSLWETTLSFLQDANAREQGWYRQMSKENWLDLISDDRGKSYNLNFEIVHRSFLESEPYQAYVEYLDKAGGFYRERWGDAPIRTIATALFLPRRAFYYFSSITGYQHEHPNFICPDYAWCDCDPKKSGKNYGGNW
ncbi:hypothetical protein JCM16303_001424 [Sporobolomyces ruberrimus]